MCYSVYSRTLITRYNKDEDIKNGKFSFDSMKKPSAVKEESSIAI